MRRGLEPVTEIIGIAAVGVVLIGVVVGYLQTQQTADNVKQAICSLRHERLESIHAGRIFLKHHPNGIPGITRDDILRSIEQQQETVRAFRFADC